MYEYILRVTMSNKKLEISDELEKAIIAACENANETSNSKRYGRVFIYQKRIDPYAVQIQLTSDTPVNASRSISSITRALLRTYDKKDELNEAMYCGSILNALVENETVITPGIDSLEPNEIIEEIFKLFYSQSKMSPTQKRKAKLAAESIEKIVIEYLNS